MNRSAVTFAAAILAVAATATARAAEPTHTILMPDTIKWMPGPPNLPPGIQMAALHGDPAKAGLFVIRARIPDGTVFAPHWHSRDENITVLQGKFLIGEGDTLDESKLEAVGAGGFFSMPGEMRHFGRTEGPTLIEISGLGPFDIRYVNPADDPSPESASTAR